MTTNVEIKARVKDLPRILRLAGSLTGGTPTVLEQEDTFFTAARGRLKLRKFSTASGEIIAYDRPDAPGPTVSRYQVVATGEPDRLREALAAALEVVGTVRKRRRLFLAGQTRIHVDEVEGLGPFLELEVVLRPGQTAEEGESIARDLMERLEVPEENLVSVAYIDLLRGGE